MILASQSTVPSCDIMRRAHVYCTKIPFISPIYTTNQSLIQAFELYQLFKTLYYPPINICLNAKKVNSKRNMMPNNPLLNC
nr:MAG TPA: hypothetical protein [Caudoviricetes sp.]